MASITLTRLEVPIENFQNPSINLSWIHPLT